MKKMSVAEAAKLFGISKEAVHNRIRRGTLKSVVEDGLKMVIVDEKRVSLKRVSKNLSSDERYYKLLEAQNIKLQEQVERLEKETRALRDQKEQMLIAERQKIERIYKEKDEQLKNILQTISSKFMLTSSFNEKDETVETEMVEVGEERRNSVISLKKYLKKSGFSKKRSKKIKKIFKKNAKNDKRIIQIGSKYYIDTAKYDYCDLMEKKR